MAVTREQGDQVEEQGRENRDPALTVKSQHHRSQPQPTSENNTPVPRVARAHRLVPSNGPLATALLVEQRSQGRLAQDARNLPSLGLSAAASLTPPQAITAPSGCPRCHSGTSWASRARAAGSSRACRAASSVSS